MTAPRRIPTSRLLVGILLHFCVPAYLLACLAAALLKVPLVTDWADVPARMLWTAAWFVPGFLLATAGAGMVGALLDRRRPPERDAVAQSRADVAEGRRLLAAIPRRGFERVLERLDTQRWDHADPSHQRVAADLAAAARTFTAAYASAEPDGRAGVLDLASESVDRLADAMTSLAEQRRRLDAGDARTVAGYLKARYGDNPRV